MQSGSVWKFVDVAPRPVNQPARASGNSIPGHGSLQVQQPRQPVLELSDTQEIEAAARAFFIENPPGPGPRANATAAAGESVLGPTTEEASTDLRQSTFFHMSFTVTAKMLRQDAAEWTKGVAESLATYVFKNCVEGIVV